MANPKDGTQLGTADVIATEYISPNTDGVRVNPNLPGTGYAIPRSKIAVGDYGQDHGDACQAQPLHVMDAVARRLREIDGIREREENLGCFQRYAGETINLVDTRGHAMTNRGVR